MPKPPSSQQLGGFELPCSREGFCNRLAVWLLTKMLIGVVVRWLPAVSTARTEIVWEPFETEREFQL